MNVARFLRIASFNPSMVFQSSQIRRIPPSGCQAKIECKSSGAIAFVWVNENDRTGPARVSQTILL